MKASRVAVLCSLLLAAARVECQIFGGREVDQMIKYPYQAYIYVEHMCEYMVDRPADRPYWTVISSCGGVVITNRYVLTAAHCIPNLKSVRHQNGINYNYLRQSGTVFLGMLTQGNHQQEFGVERFIAHKRYDPDRADDDIGLVRTNGDIRITNWGVARAVLGHHKGGDASTDFVCHVTGYGRTRVQIQRNVTRYTKRLVWAEMRVLNNADESTFSSSDEENPNEATFSSSDEEYSNEARFSDWDEENSDDGRYLYPDEGYSEDSRYSYSEEQNPEDGRYFSSKKFEWHEDEDSDMRELRERTEITEYESENSWEEEDTTNKVIQSQGEIEDKDGLISDSTNGDSGGPLSCYPELRPYYRSQHKFVYGLVSRGCDDEECGVGYWSYNVRVSAHLNWIRHNIGGGEVLLDGLDAVIGQFPHQVAIYNGPNFVCSGTILSAYWVIAAKGCLAANYRVVAGKPNLVEAAELSQTKNCTEVRRTGKIVMCKMHHRFGLRNPQDRTFPVAVKELAVAAPRFNARHCQVVDWMWRPDTEERHDHLQWKGAEDVDDFHWRVEEKAAIGPRPNLESTVGAALVCTDSSADGRLFSIDFANAKQYLVGIRVGREEWAKVSGARNWIEQNLRE